MAYTPKVPERVVRTGLDPVYTAAPGAGVGNGFSVQNGGTLFLHVVNGGAAPVVVTADIPRLVDGQPVDDREVTVPVGESRFLGPYPTGIYNQEGSVGNVMFVDFDQIDTVTMAAMFL